MCHAGGRQALGTGHIHRVGRQNMPWQRDGILGFASEMHDLFIPFAIERDRLRAQPKKERSHMVTPQDLCSMLTPQDVKRRLVTPGDLLWLKRVRFVI